MRPPRVTALALVLVAFALRVFRLDLQSLWYDEAFSVYLARLSLAEITARTAADIQPPLYYYLLHFWILFVGDSEFALRFLSLIFGVLTLPLMFVLAQRLFDMRTAWRATLIATISALYVWYSQEARMYTLITFLLLLSSYALWRELVKPGNAEKQGIWGRVFILANVAAIYTHYFAFVVIAFQLLFALYQLIWTRHTPRFKFYRLRFTLYFSAIFIAFLPWLPFALARFGQDVSYWRGALKLDEALRHIAINFTTGESVLEAQAVWIALGWLSCWLMGWLAGWFVRSPKTQNQKSKILFLILYLLVPLVLLLFLFSRNPKFNARYLMIASPAFFILLAVSLASISRLSQFAIRNLLSLSTWGFLVFTSGYAVLNIYFDPAFTKADFRGVARYIENHSAPNEAILLMSGHLFPAFNYYYRGDAPQIRLPDEPTLNTERVLGFAVAHDLNATIAGKRGVWVVEWQNEVVDPNGVVPMLLNAHGVEQKLDATFWHVRVRHWTLNTNARFADTPQPVNRREANFNNKVNLLGFDTPAPTPADVGASFNLYWHVRDSLDDDYLVALRIRDAAGNVWGKLDRRPAGYNYPTTRWKKDEYLFGAYTVPLLAGTPAGDYFVEITFYTTRQPVGLDVLAPNGAPLGKSVRVGPIPVLPATQPASLASLNIQHTISQPLGPFTLLGYQLERRHASAGESVPLTLFWRADQMPTRDYTFRIQFGPVTSAALPMVNSQFPTSHWRAGEIVRGQYRVSIPAEVQDGATQLRILLSDDHALDLASFIIEKTERVFVKPKTPFLQQANFGNVIALAGYDLPFAQLKPGATLKLTLHWNALAKMDKSYTVFVHLLDQDNQVVAQKDISPVNGTRPTTGWVVGEYIADTYELVLKPGTAPGSYRIEIGWYDAQDWTRLYVFDANGIPTGDHLILDTPITIGP